MALSIEFPRAPAGGPLISPNSETWREKGLDAFDRGVRALPIIRSNFLVRSSSLSDRLRTSFRIVSLGIKRLVSVISYTYTVYSNQSNYIYFRINTEVMRTRLKFHNFQYLQKSIDRLSYTILPTVISYG